MSKLNRQNLIYLTLSTLLVTGGYLFLRYAYRVADQFPFSQEIVLVILGTIVTMFITAILLNKQTEVELKKEENIKFIDLKTSIYIELIEHLEEVILDGNIDERDKIKLRILAHKLAIVASHGVLQQFEKFIEEFNKIASDEMVDTGDINTLMDELAELSIYIRKDLIGDLDMRHGIDQHKIALQILENSDALQAKG